MARRKAVKKPGKKKLPASINNGEYYTGSPAALLYRKNAVLNAQLDKKDWNDTKELVSIVNTQGAIAEDLVMQVNNGNLSLIPRRDEECLKLADALLKLSKFTEYLCVTDDARLANAGFQLTGQRKPPKPNQAPENLRVKSVVTKTIGARIKKVSASKVYYYDLAKITEGVQAPWQTFEWGFVTFNFSNLDKGTNYAVRVGSVDKNGQVLYCEPASQLCN